MTIKLILLTCVLLLFSCDESSTDSDDDSGTPPKSSTPIIKVTDINDFLYLREPDRFRTSEFFSPYGSISKATTHNISRYFNLETTDFSDQVVSPFSSDIYFVDGLGANYDGHNFNPNLNMHYNAIFDSSKLVAVALTIFTDVNTPTIIRIVSTSDKRELDNDDIPAIIPLLNNQSLKTYGIGHFDTGEQDPEFFGLTTLDDEYLISGRPQKDGNTKLGIDENGNTFFQSKPTSDVTKKSSLPLNSVWLTSDGTLTGGAISGYNYVIVDNNASGTYETIFLIKLDSANPADVNKTHLVSSITNDDDSLMDFNAAKTVLDMTK